MTAAMSPITATALENCRVENPALAGAADPEGAEAAEAPEELPELAEPDATAAMAVPDGEDAAEALFLFSLVL
jgi:hypothetical protein